MSKSSVALIGPAGLPDSTGETLWCPRALRERAWAAWRAKGLPSKGVEDYLYMDWRRLESVTVVPNQPNAITQTMLSALRLISHIVAVRVWFC